MSPTVNIALFGIVPLAVVLCGSLSARAGILSTLLCGWLFLPIAKLSIVGIPDYDKLVATNLAILLGCVLFHSGPLLALRPKWCDLPLALWCLAPSLSSLANDLGAYDALSVGVRQVLVWAIPYVVGRAYFGSNIGMRDLATALIVGGLVYVPFCLAEVRLSPQLHNMVYGYQQNQFWRNIRFDGFRPIVFMQSGLMVGTWMAASSVVAIWSWVTGRTRVMSLSWPLVCVTLVVTTVLCKALYAILLMLVAVGLLAVLRKVRTTVPLVLLLLSVPTYMILRTTQAVRADSVSTFAVPLFGADRAQSLEARLLQEDALQKHVEDRLAFGWGGWRRSWPKDPYTGDFELRGLDGLWTIVLGENGCYGLFTLFLFLLTPVALMLARFDANELNRDDYGAAAALSVSLLLFACDCLLNGMLNPFYLVIAGGLAALQPQTEPAVASADAATIAPPRQLVRSLRWSRPTLPHLVDASDRRRSPGSETSA
ncbi:hypothetical protein Pla108_17500 [Botrimarina colliarenosi]|uniref:O-Antigen ligase n=1 Tax=Botrimarina colliarenosi TaxID=2528001 RepID=A0A5C6AE67_9BACT|nr:hypothetical protein [Botrimarina colliarenosi]TWT97598.1 hypothetical protein Pla108_17500 [Botrimarina colliarenosi]